MIFLPRSLACTCPFLSQDDRTHLPFFWWEELKHLFSFSFCSWLMPMTIPWNGQVGGHGWQGDGYIRWHMTRWYCGSEVLMVMTMVLNVFIAVTVVRSWWDVMVVATTYSQGCFQAQDWSMHSPSMLSSVQQGLSYWTFSYEKKLILWVGKKGMPWQKILSILIDSLTDKCGR